MNRGRSILIVGSGDDAHVTRILDHLDDRGRTYSLIDPFDATAAGIDLALGDQFRISLCAGKKIQGDFAAAWWRLKPDYRIDHHSVEAYYDQQFAFGEWVHVLSSLHGLDGLTWINTRSAHVFASNKLNQLRSASELGLKLPKTLVSNSASEIRDFIERHGTDGCIYKSLMPYMSPDGRLTYTTAIDLARLDAMASQASVCPGIYQSFEACDVELRVTVVGCRMHCAKIKKSDRQKPDWRREIFDDIYEDHHLTESHRRQLLSLHTRLGLAYGAYDVMVDDAGEMIFLEVNPAGQWLWLEERLGHPISRDLAELLVSVADQGLDLAQGAK